jgi:hypothetical protein
MPEASSLSDPAVYELRVVLRGVSPLVWRRLLVRSDTTIADLHTTLQTALGWSDEHLNRFVIHGREYGVSHVGGIGFRDERCVRLVDFGLRIGERFRYEYDLTDGWQHDIRLEQILPLETGRRYPVCIGGRRALPPEDCGGPWAFLELRQRFSIISIADRMLELVERRLVIGAETFVHDHYEDVMQLLRWLEIDRFDRRGVNQRLAEHVAVQVETMP